MPRYSYVFLLVLLAFFISVQATAAQKPAQQSGLTVDGIQALVQAGVSDDVIIARLKRENKPFDLSTDEIIRLKQSEVSDAVLKAMMNPSAEVSAPTPQPVTVAPVYTGLTPAQPSGATPIAAGAVAGDPNDPMSPHDSGIYVFAKERDGKARMILLERAAVQGAKSGGFFAAAMTYGAVKAKTKAEIPGPQASVRVTDASPVFYFYFDDKQAGLGKTNFGTNALSNPNQFALLKLDVKKSNRETVIGKFSQWGSSSGTDSSSMIQFKSERIRAGLYKVMLDGMKAGEYCFYANTGGTTSAGPFAVTNTSGTDLFDFGVDLQ